MMPPVHLIATRRAFTLVELLLSIGILAILIGLLIPVLSSTMLRSNEAVCQAEMHQLGTTITVYCNDNKGVMPFPLGKDRAGNALFPDGEPIPAGYFSAVANHWWLAMKDEFDSSPLHDGLTCPSDTVSEPRTEYTAHELGLEPGTFNPPLVRTISRAFYYPPAALGADNIADQHTWERVARLDEARFPSTKAMLVEDEPFHDTFTFDDQYIVSASMPFRRMVTASDGSTQLRSIADAANPVLISLDVPPNYPGDPQTFLDNQRLLAAFHFTRDGVLGRDW